MARFVLLLALVVAGCAGNVDEIDVGSCFDDPGSGEIRNVSFVDCDAPHHHEVYAVLTTRMAGDEFPGEKALVDEAQVRCIAGFAAFVGGEFAGSALDIFYFYPTDQSWAEGDRRIACSVSLLSGDRLTGTARGSGL